MAILTLTHSPPTTHSPPDASCPICFTQLLAILTEEEIAIAMDSPAHPIDELGVTRLKDTCGHVFCRKELSVPFACLLDTDPFLVLGSGYARGCDLYSAVMHDNMLTRSPTSAIRAPSAARN
jgi:hypothetical protein